MSSFDRLMATGLLVSTATLGTGCSAVESALKEEPYHGSVYTPAQEASLENTRELIVSQWDELEGVKVNLVDGEETFTCSYFKDNAEKMNAGSSPDYCSLTNTVSVTSNAINMINRRALGIAAQEGVTFNPKATEIVVMGHEFGHAKQTLLGALAVTSKDKAESTKQRLKRELQADCYAGQITAKVDRELLDDAVLVYETFAPEEIKAAPDHGTASMRIASFQKGAKGERC